MNNFTVQFQLNLPFFFYRHRSHFFLLLTCTFYYLKKVWGCRVMDFVAQKLKENISFRFFSRSLVNSFADIIHSQINCTFREKKKSPLTQNPKPSVNTALPPPVYLPANQPSHILGFVFFFNNESSILKKTKQYSIITYIICFALWFGAASQWRALRASQSWINQRQTTDASDVFISAALGRNLWAQGLSFIFFLFFFRHAYIELLRTSSICAVRNLSPSACPPLCCWFYPGSRSAFDEQKKCWYSP